MHKEKIQVINKTGLHARSASKLVKKANQYKSNIFLSFAGREADTKSILGVMSLGVEQGDNIVLKIDGEDETRAARDLKNFFKYDIGNGEQM
ncbi:MAG: HPr family phosphocarrier protein [Halanaerobiales bacterium]